MTRFLARVCLLRQLVRRPGQSQSHPQLRLALAHPLQVQSGGRPGWEGQVHINLLAISEEGRVIYLRGYGFIEVFVHVNQAMEDVQFWATSDLDMTEAMRKQVAEHALAIEQ
jgi:hypothetical protein